MSKLQMHLIDLDDIPEGVLVEISHLPAHADQRPDPVSEWSIAIMTKSRVSLGGVCACSLDEIFRQMSSIKTRYHEYKETTQETRVLTGELQKMQRQLALVEAKLSGDGA